MVFCGWTDEAVEFFEGLAADNSRAYWQAHREVYDERVRAPMEELLTALSPEFGTWRLFRPYRDVRFSADKSPYKTNIAGTLAGGGYVSFSADGVFAACGEYAMARDQLVRFRAAVVDDRTGEPLAQTLAALEWKGISATAHDRLRTAPRGYQKDAPRDDLLRLKGLATTMPVPPEDWLESGQAVGSVRAFLRASAPVLDWLHRHVGSSELDKRR